MKKVLLFIFCSIFAFLSFSSSAQENILIDVGHSPKVSGATSQSGIPEYLFNQNLALKIQYYLNHLNYSTYVFNDTTSTSKLSDRTKGNYSLFLSVHHDSMPLHMWDNKEHWKGFSLFVSSKNPYYKQSLNCALLVGKNLVDTGFTPSLFHGLPISGENRTILSSQYGVHEYTNLVVLKTAKSPALLLEAGVIVNSEEKELLDAKRQNLMSSVVAQSLAQCYKNI